MAENTIKPLLSIAIPTFNRAACLRECLDSIGVSLSVTQAKGRCEIVISDNASTDDTASVVQSFETVMPVCYFRQSSNIGAHANFRAAASLAAGDYVWVLGDDDKITPSALGQILSGLESGMGAVICNVAVYDRNFTRIIRSRFLNVSENIVFSEPNHVMARVGIHVGYISAVILNRRAFLDVPLVDYLRFDRGGSCFMYATYQVLRSCGPVLLLAEPVVLNRGGEGDGDDGGCSSPTLLNRWWNETFAGGFPQALAALRVRGYSSSAIRAAYAHTMFSYIFPRLMFLKNTGRPVRGLVRQVICNMATSWTVWALLVPLSLVPGMMLRGLRPCKRVLAKWMRV